jgi:hypothetical protein
MDKVELSTSGDIGLGIGVGLLAIRAAAARYHFQTLDFLAHRFVEDGVGKEDQPARGQRGERTEGLASPTDVVRNMLW